MNYNNHYFYNYFVSESSRFTLVHNNTSVFYRQCFAVHAVNRERRHDDSWFDDDRQIDT